MIFIYIFALMNHKRIILVLSVYAIALLCSYVNLEISAMGFLFGLLLLMPTKRQKISIKEAKKCLHIQN